MRTHKPRWRDLVCLAALASLTTLGSRHAVAQTLPGGATVVFDKIPLIHHEGDEELSLQDETVTRKYFNQAHCLCSQNNAGTEQTFGAQLSLKDATVAINRPAELWFGDACDDEQQRPTKCVRDDANGIADLDALATSPVTKEFSLFRFMEPTGTTCTQRELESRVWVLVDSDASGSPDYFVSSGVTTDTLPPGAASLTLAEGAEEAVVLEWEPPANVNDVFVYQAFCVRADDEATPVRESPPAAQYQTANQLCALTATDVSFTPQSLDSAAPVAASPVAPIAALNPAYLCGEAANSATSLRIDGLENEVEYHVALATVDRAGNASVVYLSHTVKPLPVVDFWEDLNNRGSDVDGGLCLMAKVYGDGGPITTMLRGFRDHTLSRTALGRWLTRVYYQVAGDAPWLEATWLRVLLAVVLLPLVAIAWLLHTGLWLGALGWIVWRQWRQRWRRVLRTQRWLPMAGATGAMVLAIAAGPNRAYAQPESPYWTEEDEYQAEAGAVDDPIRWRVGFKLGPYFPAIDEQFGTEPGPFEEMFGSGGLMPQFDLDRIVWRGFGHLAVSGSVGYYGRTAKAFQQGSTPGDPDRPRSTSDSNKFRLMPLSLGVAYRLTQLHEHWRIPLVPYGRAALAYGLWWVKAPSGDLARVDDDKALGGSLGWTGAVGLSLRLDWIDRDAMYSMRESGIYHAGFYAELQTNRIDGFGQDGKLAVGDNTWFAGVDFEF